MKLRTLVKKPKKGFSGVLAFIIILVAVMVIAMILAFTGAITNWFSDEVTPTLEDLGVIGSTNFTEVADVTLTPINSIVHSMQWMVGVLYFIMLVGTLIFAYGYRSSENKLYLILFFMLIFLAILMSIWVSNTYEGFHSQDDAVGLQLQAMTLASFLILNSPVVIIVMGFIGGIIMMTPSEREGIY